MPKPKFCSLLGDLNGGLAFGGGIGGKGERRRISSFVWWVASSVEKRMSVNRKQSSILLSIRSHTKFCSSDDYIVEKAIF